QRDDIDDLDERIDRRPGRILVGVADRIAGDGRLVGLGTFAAEVAFLDVLLGIVPGAAAGAHRDRDKQPGDDRADQPSAPGPECGSSAQYRIEEKGAERWSHDGQ